MKQSPIVLVAINARYSHPSFGARYLAASLQRAGIPYRLLEFTYHHSVPKIVDQILEARASVVCLGVYIWNAGIAEKLVATLKESAPAIPLILGGPEVSYEPYLQNICRLANLTVSGEADLAFPQICSDVLKGRSLPAVLHVAPPDLSRVPLPYDLYTQDDLEHRNIYVETTRGCPFACAYCLSAIRPGLRRFPLPAILRELDKLIRRGAKRIKFVDRTFNSDMERALTVLRFLLPRVRPPVQVHLEMIPDRFPPPLLELAAQFPPGCLRFEIGIQTWNPETARLINRHTRYEQVEENLTFLLTKTGVEVHADLLAGLPGESMDDFGRGFNRLLRLGPQEIQVGILKRLRGAPIAASPAEWEMNFDPCPPYRLRSNRWLSAAELDELCHFSRLWDRIYNRRRFRSAMDLFRRKSTDPFRDFLALTRQVLQRHHRSYALALDDLACELYEWLVNRLGIAPDSAVRALVQDYSSARRRLPRTLRRLGARGSSP